jgi:hypothetical protein
MHVHATDPRKGNISKQGSKIINLCAQCPAMPCPERSFKGHPCRLEKDLKGERTHRKELREEDSGWEL